MAPTSNLWNHFRKLDNGQAACNYCGAQYKSINTRAAMLYHIKSKHSSMWSRPSSMSQEDSRELGSEDSRQSQSTDERPSASDGMGNNLRSNSNSPKKDTPIRKSASYQKSEGITKRIAACIAMDMLPISLVEGEGFNMLIRYLAPQYTMASRTAMYTRIKDVYKATKKKIVENVQKYEAVALTTDAWTSRTTTSFVTVTLHAVSSDWQIKCHTLDSLNMSERHTAENLRDHLGRVVLNWNLQNKVVAIAHDNASNITSAVRSSTLLGSSVPCFAHTLQCAITSAFKDVAINIILSNASTLVGHFKHSTIATTGLKQYQRNLELPEHALIQRCRTRWNSSFYMAERLTEQRPAVIAVLTDEKFTKKSTSEDLTMPDEEWDLLEDMMKVLRPFEVATRVMCKENYPTLSMVRPLVLQFVKKFMKESGADSDHIKNLKKILRTELTSRFLGSDKVNAASLACVLDPRYKIMSAENDTFSDRVMQEIEEILRKENVPSQPPPSKDKYGKEMDYLFDDDAELVLSQQLSQTSLSPNSLACSEFTQYLRESPIARTEDPLQWWKSRQKKYPNLAKVARKYMAIPATSVSSERVFSTAGNIINAKRNSLSPENANMLIFLYQNKDVLRDVITSWE